MARKNPMASSRPSSSSGKETELVYSADKNDLIAVDKNAPKKRTDIVPVTDFDDAEKKIRIWIEKNVGVDKKECSWVTKWGSKTTSKLTNIGKVIGKSYIIEKDYVSNGKPLASYRVDWDEKKGIHYNPVIRIDHKHEDAFFLRIQLPQLANQSLLELPAIEISYVHEQCLLLTKEVLKNKEPMPEDYADSLLINYMRLEDRTYFQSFGMLLRPLINAALSAADKHTPQMDFGKSDIDPEVIRNQVTRDLFQLWRDPVLLCLADIRNNVELTNESSISVKIAKVFVSECEYVKGKNLSADTVERNIKETITLSDAGAVPVFLNHLSDTLSLNRRNKEGLVNALTQQLLGSKRSSTSNIMQALSIIPKPEKKSSNDNEFKPTEKKEVVSDTISKERESKHVARHVFNDVSNQANVESSQSDSVRRFGHN